MTGFTYSIYDDKYLYADFKSAEAAMSWIASNPEAFLNEDIALVVFDDEGFAVVALIDARKENRGEEKR